MRAWLSKNKDRVNKERRERRKADADYRERVRGYSRKRVAKDPEANRARAAAWRKDNPERYKENMRQAHLRNVEKRRAKSAKWKKDNPEKANINAVEYFHRRRSRMLNGGDAVSCKALITKWRQAKTFRCYLCALPFPIKSLEVDHFIPLAKGGLHTPDNLRKACGPCNRSKGDRLL